jgi:hypothetical protein
MGRRTDKGAGSYHREGLEALLRRGRRSILVDRTVHYHGERGDLIRLCLLVHVCLELHIQFPPMMQAHSYVYGQTGGKCRVMTHPGTTHPGDPVSTQATQ